MTIFARNLRLMLLTLLVAAGLRAAGQSLPDHKIDSLKQVLATAADTARPRVLHLLTAWVADQAPAQAMAYAQQGLAESQRLSWPRGQAQALTDIGRLYLREDNISEAQKFMLRALTLWRGLHENRQALRAICAIADILGRVKQFRKSLDWQRQALTGALASQDTLALTRAYIGMGLIHNRQQQPNDALLYYQQALDLAQHLNETRNGIVGAVLNNLAGTYLELNQPKLALPYSLRALRLVHAFGTLYDFADYERTLASTYGQLGKWDMANYHALEARQLSSRCKNISSLIISNNLLDTLYVQQGNYQLARQYVVENRALEAKVRTQEQERKVAELQGRYDTQEKERNIKLLTQQNQIAHLAALQQRTLRNAAIVSALLLLLAMAILINRYRLRQRTVRLLDEQNREKELLLREKTLLLQEVHHRVKNNLQIVLSLLSNQLDTLPDPVAAAAIRESQSRVQTMALIHQNLYQSENLARIDMRRYLAELLDAIGQAFRREEVAVRLDVAPMQLTTTTAVPLGLIVNELVTNAYKYAFAGRTHNLLHVELRPAGPGAYCLMVADNGIGLPAFDLDAVQSLGLRLTVGLLRQLHAEFSINRTAGTCFHITFQELSGARFNAAPLSAPAHVSAHVRF